MITLTDSFSYISDKLSPEKYSDLMRCLKELTKANHGQNVMIEMVDSLNRVIEQVSEEERLKECEEEEFIQCLVSTMAAD